jgi:hypothetical protein
MVRREQHVDYYDFDIAGGFMGIQEPFSIEAGDSFRTTCYYQGNGDVKFGLGSDEEMCIGYLMYYPAIPDFNGYCAYPTGDLPDTPVLVDGCSASAESESVDEKDMRRTFGTSCLAEDDDIVDTSSAKARLSFDAIIFLLLSSVLLFFAGNP